MARSRAKPEPAADQIDLEELPTEAINPASAQIDRMGALEIARLMNEADATVAGAVRRQLPQIAQAIEGIAARLTEGGRLVYMGAGTSGRLGVLDAAECPPTFSTPPEMVLGWIAGGPQALTRAVEEVEDDPAQGRADAQRLNLSARDVLVGIAASGRTPYVAGALQYAQEAGALAVALACNPNPPVGRYADITIAIDTGPEVIAGSTRLKAGTAQKMVLNMLSTGAMVLIGKTYGNLMVDVQPTNAKLRQRAVRIVQAASGLPASEAARLLADSHDDPKTAIVAALAGLSPQQAHERLARAGGVVRRAIEGSET